MEDMRVSDSGRKMAIELLDCGQKWDVETDKYARFRNFVENMSTWLIEHSRIRTVQ